MAIAAEAVVAAERAGRLPVRATVVAAVVAAGILPGAGTGIPQAATADRIADAKVWKDSPRAALFWAALFYFSPERKVKPNWKAPRASVVVSFLPETYSTTTVTSGRTSRLSVITTPETTRPGVCALALPAAVTNNSTMTRKEPESQSPAGRNLYHGGHRGTRGKPQYCRARILPVLPCVPRG